MYMLHCKSELIPQKMSILLLWNQNIEKLLIQKGTKYYCSRTNVQLKIPRHQLHFRFHNTVNTNICLLWIIFGLFNWCNMHTPKGIFVFVFALSKSFAHFSVYLYLYSCTQNPSVKNNTNIRIACYLRFCFSMLVFNWHFRFVTKLQMRSAFGTINSPRLSLFKHFK